jgi:Na+/proline symporter
MVAALLAAGMSTFDSTINAGASYVVKDLYQPSRVRATERELVWVGYIASALIVGLGLAIALLAEATVLGIWVSIVMLLFPAFLVPFALRWYWARFNGAGFAAGIVGGFAAALTIFLFPPQAWNEAVQFLVVAASSLSASLAATVIAAPVDHETLRQFYRQVAPFGFWPRDWRSAHRHEHRTDIVRLVIALLWQVLTFLLPMGLVLGMWKAVIPAAIIWTLLLWHLLRYQAQPESALTPKP